MYIALVDNRKDPRENGGDPYGDMTGFMGTRVTGRKGAKYRLMAAV